VIAMEVNSVLAYKLYPRSLLTIFTDDVHLTDGDERAYRLLAQAQRQKGFEVITVTFDNPLDHQDPDGGGDTGGDGGGGAEPEAASDAAAEPPDGESIRGGAGAAVTSDEAPAQSTSGSGVERGEGPVR